MFRTITPESAGISSRRVLEYIRTLDEYRLVTHGIIFSRGQDIFAEAYYAPYDQNTKHRMYSVSKSITAIAVGFAIDDGLFTLDTPVMDFFPEYDGAHIDTARRCATVRDLLTMRSPIASYDEDWWGKPDRLASYFRTKSVKPAGTNYYYDTAACFTLGALVEKLTGKPLLEYIKDKGLCELGFSRDAYSLLAPGGHSHCDSGIMCTARDMLLLARLLANGGELEGHRYLSEEYARAATSRQTDNDRQGQAAPLCIREGYGYFVWKTRRDGFAFLGMADQYAIYDTKTDFLFVITSENLSIGNEGTKMLIMHELYKTIIDSIGEPLPEDPEAYRELCEYCETRKLLSLTDGVSSTLPERIHGARFQMEENPMGFETVWLEFEDDHGTLNFTKEGSDFSLPFGIGYNVFGKFPTKERCGMTASVMEEGQYDAATSAIFCEENKMLLTARIVDTYLGNIHMNIAFRDDDISISCARNTQRILLEFNGYAYGKRIQ